MDNNELYANEAIEQYLEERSQLLNLDIVTVKSLFRTTMESVTPELPRTAVIIRSINHPQISKSIKLKNIRFNLDFALEMILGISNVIDGSKVLLIVLVLDVLKTFFTNATVDLEEEDAYLICVIYKLDYSGKGVLVNDIRRYIQDDSMAKEKSYFVHEHDLETSFGRLEGLHCIELANERYHVVETIVY